MLWRNTLRIERRAQGLPTDEDEASDAIAAERTAADQRFHATATPGYVRATQAVAAGRVAAARQYHNRVTATEVAAA